MDYHKKMQLAGFVIGKVFQKAKILEAFKEDIVINLAENTFAEKILNNKILRKQMLSTSSFVYFTFKLLFRLEKLQFRFH